MTIAGTKSFNIDTSEIEKMANVFGTSGPMVQSEMRTGMRAAGGHTRDAAAKHIKNKSGDLAKSGKVEVTLTGKTVEARVRFGAPYARIVNDGRGPVVAQRAKALRFEIDGEVLFRKRVGPAAGVHYLEKGQADAAPKVQAELEATTKRIAANLEKAI